MDEWTRGLIFIAVCLTVLILADWRSQRRRNRK